MRETWQNLDDYDKKFIRKFLWQIVAYLSFYVIGLFCWILNS
jgi:hypothetical protein